ncbi:hypothetical protein CF326_g6042 [Tilletia indica]|nr:hypothetical protein CF326_g6042 [Tilletia indica]
MAEAIAGLWHEVRDVGMAVGHSPRRYLSPLRSRIKHQSSRLDNPEHRDKIKNTAIDPASLPDLGAGYSNVDHFSLYDVCQRVTRHVVGDINLGSPFPKLLP